MLFSLFTLYVMLALVPSLERFVARFRDFVTQRSRLVAKSRLRLARFKRESDSTVRVKIKLKVIIPLLLAQQWNLYQYGKLTNAVFCFNQMW